MLANISVILLFFFIQGFETYSHIHRDLVFPENLDLCSIKCTNRPHTLCNASLLKSPTCNDFKSIEMTEEKRILILNGHNALRDRLAFVEPVANMIKLEWDSQLASMAYQWVLRCKVREKDPCTQINDKNETDPSLKHTLIHQNIAFIHSKFLPQYYELKIFRYWYIEKLSLSVNDKFKNETTSEIFFMRETNFSMLAWARLQRVGCALGRYHEGFAMVCNYFPFQGYNTSAYITGPAGSECPRSFPLRSVIFQNLCTAKGHITQVNVLIMIVMLTTTLRNINIW